MERVNPNEKPTDLPVEGSGGSRQDEAPPPLPAQKRRMGKKPYYMVKTKGGHPLDEVTSALQKSIRRGLEEEAMHWALEMSDSGLGQYLWRRLMVIAAEDIGLADPQALILTTCGWLATKEATKSFSKPPGMKTEFLGLVILHLCRAPKNREGDDFVCYVIERRKGGWKIEVPDFALDGHTDRGRRMKRGDEFWWQESSRLNKPVEIEGDKYKEKLGELSSTGSQPKLAMPDSEGL